MCAICEAGRDYGAWVIESKPLTRKEFNYLLPAICRNRLHQGATKNGQEVFSILTTQEDWPDIQARLRFLD